MMTLIPPSAMTMAPTIKLDFSDARKATPSAISSGCAARLMGASFPCSARNSRPSSRNVLRRLVTTSPAPTAFTNRETQFGVHGKNPLLRTNSLFHIGSSIQLDLRQFPELPEAEIFGGG